MDTSKIGTARQQDDNKIAVVNAKSLAECWQELSAIFEQTELQSADYQPEQLATYRAMRAEPDDPDAQAWIKSCIMADKANDALRVAFHHGELPLWRVHDAREVPVAPDVLDRNNVKYGIFKTYERPEPDMQGARLWVKRPDWEVFLARTVIPDPGQQRLPPSEPFVTLSQALTWIAFGVAMDTDLVHALLCLDSYGGRVPQEAIKDAVVQLTANASGGNIAMRGKYWEGYRVEKRTLLTAPIEAVKLADYRQFNYLRNELRYGDGLTWWRNPDGVTDRLVHGGRSDSFIEVSVDRADLLREYPFGNSSERPPTMIVMPMPDGWGGADCKELPPWLNPYQLVAWVQYRDLIIVAKADTWNGLAAQHMYGTEPQNGRVVDLERALQEGLLTSYGLTKSSETFAPIPTVEWTRIALAPLDTARQHPYLHIKVKRDDALAHFPALKAGSVPGPSTISAVGKARRKPGPAPDADWPAVMDEVARECSAARYSRPLARGQQAAIITMLLGAMANRDKHPSEDTARKYAAQVIARLPDNSTGQLSAT